MNKKPSRNRLIESAKLSARIGGCTCEPAVELREVAPGVFMADVVHGRDCRHPSQQIGGDA